MKQLKRRIFTLILSMCLLLLSGMTAFASGEGNIDGGGGSMGSGTATDVWHGQDGVRVTVVTADGSVASTPFDLSNANVANNVLNFGKVCKLQYSSGSSLSPNGSQPMRNFMMRGPAGTGKTEGAKAIAAGLGLPYLYYTCSANTEIYDFLGQMLPKTDEKPQDGREYPTLTDIQMDPPSAYKKLTGIYDEAITDAEVYEKLLEVMAQDAKALMEDNASGQRFRYVPSK
jgi:hypothetical protein